MKNTKLLLSGVCLMLLGVALASTNIAGVKLHPDSCPVITIICSSGEPCCGQKSTFSVAVAGGDPQREPTFKWKVSAGTITSGQGTGTIEVDASKAGGKAMTVTVEVGGIIPDGCPTTQIYTPECSESSSAASRARPCRGKRGN